MATTVEVGVIRGFVLDDPIRGVLDNTTYTLGGLAFEDITSRVVSVSIQRGKNRDLDRYPAGTLGVELNNEDRFFDPVSGTAIDVVPRVPIRVLMDGTAQFYGSVNDWGFTYETTGSSKVDVQASDDFVYLARQNILTEGTPIVQSSGARIEAVLDMFTVNWPSDRRAIDSGDTTVAAQPYAGENALEYLQLIETTEQGQLFIGKNGDLTFRARGASAARSDNLVTFSDSGTGLPYTEAILNYGSELLYNTATVTGPTGTATASNALSQQTYGITSIDIATLASSDDALQNLADFTVAKYAEPDLRFETLTINVDVLTSSQRSALLGMELGDVARIIFTPNKIGAAIDRYAQVIRIAHSVSPSRHDITLSFDSLDFSPLILDDLAFGRLDSDRLGF